MVEKNVRRTDSKEMLIGVTSLQLNRRNKHVTWVQNKRQQIPSGASIMARLNPNLVETEEGDCYPGCCRMYKTLMN